MPAFVCIGAPYFLGQRVPEPSAVTAVRDSGLARELGAEWVELAPDFAAHADPMTAVNRALADAIAAQRGHLPLIFASDCVNALGAARGLQSAAGLGVIWFDAHGDFNTPETSPSGFLGGMPLAMLVGRGPQTLLDDLGLSPLHEADVLLTDARDLDPAEAVALRASAVTHLPDVRALLTAALPDKPLYLHLDLDVIHPDDMPATSFVAPGGPSLDALAAVLRRIAQQGQIAGVLVSLWDQAQARDDRSLQGTLAVVRALVDDLP